MGILEKEILFYVLGWVFRWLSSNDKNKQAKAKIVKKKEDLKWL